MEIKHKAKIFIGQEAFEGYLYKDETGRILVDLASGDEFLVESTSPQKLGVLRGDLDNGFKFTGIENVLLGSTFALKDFKTYYSYRPSYLIKGLAWQGEGDLKVDSMTLTVPGLIKWGTMSSYQEDHLGNLSNSIRTKEDLYSSEDFSLAYQVEGTYVPSLEKNFLDEGLALDQRGLVVIGSNKPEGLDFFIDKFNQLMKLVSMATGINFYPSEIEVTLKDLGTFDLVGAWGQETRAPKPSGQDLDSWLVLPEFIHNGDLTLYFNRYGKFEEVLNVYILARSLRENQPIQAFLNACLALDSYYGIFKAQGQADFESRISDLLRIEDGEGFNVTSLGGKDFPSLVRSTRDFYTSYTKSLPDPLAKEGLDPYTKVLLGILDYHILTDLGFTNKHTKQNLLIKRWGSLGY